MYHFPWLFNVYMDAVMKELKGGGGKVSENKKTMDQGKVSTKPNYCHP